MVSLQTRYHIFYFITYFIYRPMRTIITALLLFATVSCFASTRIENIEVNDTVSAPATDEPDAMSVVRGVSEWLTPANFGRVKVIERNPKNTEASSTIEYRNDKRVAEMACKGFPWQYMHVTKVKSRKDLEKTIDTYLHTYNGRNYIVEITYMETGHDSATINVDVKAN